MNKNEVGCVVDFVDGILEDLEEFNTKLRDIGCGSLDRETRGIVCNHIENSTTMLYGLKTAVSYMKGKTKGKPKHKENDADSIICKYIENYDCVVDYRQYKFITLSSQGLIRGWEVKPVINTTSNRYWHRDKCEDGVFICDVPLTYMNLLYQINPDGSITRLHTSGAPIIEEKIDVIMKEFIERDELYKTCAFVTLAGDGRVREWYSEPKPKFVNNMVVWDAPIWVNCEYLGRVDIENKPAIYDMAKIRQLKKEGNTFKLSDGIKKSLNEWSDKHQELLEEVESLWKNNIGDVVVLTSDSENENRMVIESCSLDSDENTIRITCIYFNKAKDLIRVVIPYELLSRVEKV